MIKPQQTVLPDKLQKLTIKLKSHAFMKIFMKETNSPIRYQKVRHYDLELEAATAIAGWLKTKLQQVFLRHFYQIKEYKKPSLKSQSSSSKLPPHPHQHLSNLHSQTNSPSKKIPQRARCQTDRQLYQQSKQSQQQQNSRKSYRSEFGEQSQLSQKSRKSNLQSLLNKVREVNNQSKIQKQNELQKSNNYPYGHSYDGSRVLSSGSGLVGGYKKSTTRTKNMNDKYYQNDLSFCTYGPTDRNNKYASGHINPMKQFQTPGTPADKITGRINLQEEESLDKHNLISLKKWHRNQKRHVIINKIKDLENSLFAEYSRPSEYFFNEDEDVYPTTFATYELPNNYSQAYLQYKTRHPPRSVVDVRYQKY